MQHRMINQPKDKTMTLNARPHSNGNQRSDFVDAYKALTAALDAVNEAHSLIRANVIHGRNYQHLAGSDAQQALNDDKRLAFGHHVAATDAIKAIQDAIFETLKKSMD
jgi:hypothetical protein